MTRVGDGLAERFEQLPDVPEPTAEQKQRAARIVAGNAESAAEATEMLAMLGLLDEVAEKRGRPLGKLSAKPRPISTRYPGGRLCGGTCGRALVGEYASSNNVTTVRIYAGGMCGTCYRKAKREQEVK